MQQAVREVDNNIATKQPGLGLRTVEERQHKTTGNESVPNNIFNITINLLLLSQSAFCKFQTITATECMLFDKIASVYVI